MDVHLRELAKHQNDLVAGWQLRRLGWTRAMVEHHAHHGAWQVVHAGVYALGQAPLNRQQLWRAATLTAPETYLWAASAGACWGWREWEGAYETVVRSGNGGPRRFNALLVARSRMLDGHTTMHRGIAVVTSPRALCSLGPHLTPWQLGRCFRESIRLKTTTANEIAETCRALRGARGTAALRVLCDRYATIPYHRCKSDAESWALEVLHDAEVIPPQVNVDVAGREADLVWRERRLLIEIDSKEHHQFADQDLIKTARWQSAGFTVRRIAANDVYFRPELLVGAAPRT